MTSAIPTGMNRQARLDAASLRDLLLSSLIHIYCFFLGVTILPGVALLGFQHTRPRTLQAITIKSDDHVLINQIMHNVSVG